ncbi:hypothetical protein GGI15_001335 [Coemansia interrupta]|uniref:Uncharacterized protein n=1 Tax=Coemansia interrupta TaxID=1126814 RepID=A0A9W8HRE5_9FUNG|nr:hypothetical protein GGI15_001335 [Coemansia interrupta]
MTESSGKIETTTTTNTHDIKDISALIAAQENDAEQMANLRSAVDERNKEINELQEQISAIRKLIDEDEQKLIALDEAMEKREVEIMELVHGVDTASKLTTSKSKRIEALGNAKTKTRFGMGSIDDNADAFRTPEQRHRPTHPQRDLTEDITPVAQTEAAGFMPGGGAAGRRLDLERVGQRTPRQFTLHEQHPMTSMLQDDRSSSPVDGMSAFATPLQAYGARVHERTSERQVEEEEEEYEQEEMGQKAVIDPDFILNLNQEADLERLTKKAMNDVKTAGKKEIMQRLRTQVDSLQQDAWMYQ